MTQYLIIPASNIQSRAAELQNVEEWSQINNLKLNRAKTQKIIITGINWARTDLYFTLATPVFTRNQACDQSENPRSDRRKQAVCQRACPTSCPQMRAVAPGPQDIDKSLNERQRCTKCLQVGHTRQVDYASAYWGYLRPWLIIVALWNRADHYIFIL